MAGDSFDAALRELAEMFLSPSSVATGWTGFYAQLGSGPVPTSVEGWPYRTASAEVVWNKCKELVSQYPELNERAVIRLAVEKTGVRTLELTPEDWRLLEMAVEWYKNGMLGVTPPRSDVNQGPHAVSRKP